MRIAVIGSGHIGATAARLFADAGHEVAIANSRGPQTLSGLAGGKVRAETVERAASFGEIVLVATPLGAYDELPAETLAGRVVIDAGNYFPDRDGTIAALDDDSTTSSELLAARLPGASVVKGFNTLYWEVLRDGGAPDAGDERLVLFIAGDDQAAKDRVGRLIEDIGFAPVDTGTLAEGGRRQQIGGPLAGKQLTVREANAGV
jgi:8-hydroxy-5-deazaflavin:NADPH oxidoreductase